MPRRYFEWSFEPSEWRGKFLIGFTNRFDTSKTELVWEVFKETVKYGVERTALILFLLTYREPVQSAFKNEKVEFGGALPDTDDEKIRSYARAETLLMLARSLAHWRRAAANHHPLMRSISIRFFLEALKIKKTDHGLVLSPFIDEQVEDHHRMIQEQGEGTLCRFDDLL